MERVARAGKGNHQEVLVVVGAVEVGEVGVMAMEEEEDVVVEIQVDVAELAAEEGGVGGRIKGVEDIRMRLGRGDTIRKCPEWVLGSSCGL